MVGTQDVLRTTPQHLIREHHPRPTICPPTRVVLGTLSPGWLVGHQQECEGISVRPPLTQSTLFSTLYMQHDAHDAHLHLQVLNIPLSPILYHLYRRIYITYTFLMVKGQNGHSSQLLDLPVRASECFHRSATAMDSAHSPYCQLCCHRRITTHIYPLEMLRHYLLSMSRALVLSLSRHNDACCVFLVTCPVSLDVRLAVVVGSLVFQREIVCLCASDSLFNHILHAHLSTLKDLST